MKNKPIGGYFELEKTTHGGNFPQKDGVLLNTGRNALEYILASIGNVSKLYIPFYTCEVVLEPLEKLGIQYEFYHLDTHLELVKDIDLLEDEYLLFTNYFGVMDSYIMKLAQKYGNRLIVDCAQALYAKHISGIKTFYSPRKFVGIPDGAVVYMEGGISPSEFGVDYSDNRMSHLYIRLEHGPQAGYADFRNNAAKLKNLPILNMSYKTKELIENIDFKGIKKTRIQNFQLLHNDLKSTNRFIVPNIETFECPMVYPYWTSDKELKSRLIKEQVFVATYWPNVLDWTKEGMIEYEFANCLLAIPCDQRYCAEDMKRIIKLILNIH